MIFIDVPLRTRRELWLFKVYDDSTLLVLNGASMNSVNALLALRGRCQSNTEEDFCAFTQRCVFFPRTTAASNRRFEGLERDYDVFET